MITEIPVFNAGMPILLEDLVERRLMVVKPPSGLLLQDLDMGIVATQASSWRNTDGYLAMIRAHQYIRPASDQILGIHEELRRRCIVFIDEEEVEFAEIKPFMTRNIWVGKFTRLYTAEAAANIDHAGSTALICATVNNKVPEMVARASNSYFYPATINDITIPLTD